MGGEELENRCNRNNKAITQENSPNNTEDLPNNYADCKIQVGGLSFYKMEIKIHTRTVSAVHSATDIAHSISIPQMYAEFQISQ